MRDILTVMEQVEKVVPERHEMLARFEAMKKSVMFSAPELMAYRWQQVFDIICDYLPDSQKDFLPWQKRMLNIWSGQVHFPEVEPQVPC